MFKVLGLTTAVALGVAAPSFAASYSYTGTFTGDSNISLVSFTVAEASAVSAVSTSYATGGLDPILSIFDSNGALLAFNDDDDSLPSDSRGVTYDAYVSLDLAPGNYWVALSQYDSFFDSSLSEFIALSNRGNFTANWCDADSFCDDTGSSRTGDWAYTLNIDPVAPVPLPAAAPLALAGLGALAMLRRRKA